ncbi:hypothetical protein, partial [Halochromatium sp.]
NAVSSAAAVESLVGKAEEVLRLLPFEPRALRPTPASEAALHGAVAEIEALNRSIWLNRDADLTQTAEQLDCLAERFHGPAGEPGPDAPGCGSDLDPSRGPASSPMLHADPARFAGPFSRQLDQLQGAAG